MCDLWRHAAQGAADWHPAPKPVLEAAAAARRAAQAHGVDIGTLAIKDSVAAKGVAVHLMGMKTVEEVGTRYFACRHHYRLHPNVIFVTQAAGMSVGQPRWAPVHPFRWRTRKCAYVSIHLSTSGGS